MREPGMPHSKSVDIGSYLDAATALTPQAITAGGAGDNTFFDGEEIDRIARRLPQSALYVTALRLTMASGEAATVSTQVQHRDPGESYEDYPYANGDQQPADVIIPANDDGSPVITAVNVAVDLAGAKHFVRFRTRVNLSASGTDTAGVAGVVTLGGLESLPVG